MTEQPRVRLPAAAGAREVAPAAALAEALEQHRAGRLAGAASIYSAILDAVPAHFDALHLLGVLHHQQGREEEAARLIGRALELDPASADAFSNLGAVYRALGRRDEAACMLERAIELDPSLAAAHNNLGGVLQDLGRRRDAEDAYRRAISIAPTFADAHSNLAGLLLERGQHEAALRACGEALASDGRHAAALANMGNAWRALGRPDRAREALERAIAAGRPGADVHHNLALALDDEGRREAALAAWRQALEIDPWHGPALSGALVTRRVLADWQDLDALGTRFAEALERGVEGLSPFALLLEDSTPAQQLACARAWARQRAASTPPRDSAFAWRQPDDGQIRIGYVSADYHRHPTAQLIAGMIEAHDRTAFRIHAYSSGPDDGSALRKRLVAAFDAFRDVRGQSPAQIAEHIHGDGIDILVDLKGYTLEAITGVFALRPAPVQVNYLGYPGTMGADFIDYLIADDTVVPAGADAHFDERIVRLPGSYQVNDRQRNVAATPSREACGLPGRAFVFCCFNAPQKISPALFTLWMEILHAVPDSVLWLLDASPSTPLKTNLRREAGARGIAAERLMFAPRRPPEEYLAQYRLADLFLDTLPYNAHTTASDALWAGCPVLTCPGVTFASRVAASLLRAAGLPELVTGSLDDYRARAVAYGTGAMRDELTGLRDRLGRNREQCILFDTAAFTRQIEAAYLRMHERRASGEPPESFRID